MVVSYLILKIFAFMPASCRSCSFCRSCFVEEFDEEGVKGFSAGLQRFTVRGTGRAILNQGEPADCCYFLCDGLVKLTKSIQIAGVHEAPGPRALTFCDCSQRPDGRGYAARCSVLECRARPVDSDNS